MDKQLILTIFDENQEMNTKKVNAQCECGNEILQVEYWDDERNFCFAQFKYHPHWYSFRRRLRFLFTGEITYNEIMLSRESAKEIADFINDNLK